LQGKNKKLPPEYLQKFNWQKLEWLQIVIPKIFSYDEEGQYLLSNFFINFT
jgi:hypothetical protein